MTDEHANEPWAHRSTPVARGFGAALDRLDAGSGGAPTSQNHDVHGQALLISGTDTNAAELAAYVKALTDVYIAEIANDPDPGDERAALYVRGLAMTTWLAGRLAGQLDGTPSAGSTHAGPHFRVNADGTVDQLRPLETPDPPQFIGSRPDDRRDASLPLHAVLELERDRADRIAHELGAIHHPLWELFDGVARELGDHLGERGQHS